MILGSIINTIPEMRLVTDLGAADSHKYKQNSLQLSFFGVKSKSRVDEILEPDVDEKYYCSEKFQNMLHDAVGEDLNVLHGYRLIDYRGGQSLHSWELGMKGKCSDAEIRFMNALILNRRKPVFGKEQDGKKLTLEQIKTFYTESDIDEVIESLLEKRYLQEINGKYNPVCGNMSFEVFKFLDPQSISVTLTSSDANRLGVIQHNRARHITPRECARLQGFPDTFKLHPIDACSYKQFGNSVSVPVIKAVFDDFLKNNIRVLEWLNMKNNYEINKEERRIVVEG
jgi:DNA (cytosine-5)-methyltransferase 1